MNADDERPLGRTKVSITQMGFGGAPLGNLYEAFTDARAGETVDAAFDAGIRYFDTAPFYGHGLGEHRLGTALRGRVRSDFVLSTKVGRVLRPADPRGIDTGLFRDTLPFEPRFDYGYDGTMRSFEDSLQRLGTNRIEIVLVHDLDVWTHGSQEACDARLDEFMAGGYRAILALREEGVIGAIGAGVNEWEVCETLAERGDFDCFLLAGRYTLLEQQALDTMLPLCEQRGIGIIIGGPLNTGILATGAVEGAYYNYEPAAPEILERVGRIEAACKRHDVPLATAALQFPLHHPAVAGIIPGARAPAEIARNIGSFSRSVPTALWADLKSEGLVRQDAPTP
jgi:D-threo-aldose 1-dehydrogenase